MLAAASPAVVLQLYAALVRGYGTLGDLDSAHAAFLEGRQWLTQLSSAKAVAPRPGRAAARGARAAAAEAAAAAALLGAADDEDGEDAWLSIGPGVADRGAAWQRADRCLCLAMVRAAAPHPRGVLLACSLLEELGRTGAPVTDGYYSSLIARVGDARELQRQLSACTATDRADRRRLARLRRHDRLAPHRVARPGPGPGRCHRRRRRRRRRRARRGAARRDGA